MDINEKIRTLRLDRGMTQEEVAVVPKSVADYNDTPSNGEEFFFELISTLAPMNEAQRNKVLEYAKLIAAAEGK